MSLRARLAFVAAAAVAVSVVLASTIVFFIIRNELIGQLNATLTSESTTLAGTIDDEYLAHHLPFIVPTGKPGQYALQLPYLPFGSNTFQLVDSTGKIYLPQLGGTVPPTFPGASRAQAVAAGKAGPFYSQGHVIAGGVRHHVRMLTSPLTRLGNLGFASQVAVDMGSVDRELAKIRLWLLLVAIGGVGFAALAGFLVARTTLRPVRELSETAERVRQTRDLTQRIHVEGTDELSQLAATFNAMLESLDAAQQRQAQLVQDASHELRTPLTSLRTNIEVLARADELPPEDREHLLRDVVDQLGELTALVAELTELARGEEQETHVEEVRLDLVTEEAIRRTTRNHPEVPIEAELEETTVPGVPASLERAIANLLDNAAKWSPAGTPIDVRLSNGELSVRDHGPGIADADLPHVFERFYRATAARSMPGSGLGLSIVQKVAEAHGGTVTAERAADGGTVMRLRVASRNGARPS
jgi:two-component system, OmpR family, sensor histidine kinase MprB